VAARVVLSADRPGTATVTNLFGIVKTAELAVTNLFGIVKTAELAS
jgi:hypothetical protein